MKTPGDTSAACVYEKLKWEYLIRRGYLKRSNGEAEKEQVEEQSADKETEEEQVEKQPADEEAEEEQVEEQPAAEEDAEEETVEL